MDDFDHFERRLAAALRSDADMSAATFEPGTIARAATASTQRRSVRMPWRLSVMRTSNRWSAVAAVIGVLMVGGALLMIQGGQHAVVGGPSPTPSADPSPSQPAAVVSPSATPTATPSPTPTPIVWTEASLEEDWPAPVRTEPAGGASGVPLHRDDVAQDPSGDTGSAAHPWVDIHEVGFCPGQTACIRITLVSNQPPVLDPSEQWIAYGVVVDDDGDGVPDRRFGVDNSQVAASGEDPQRRQWITDLHTGRTLLEDDFGETFFDTFYPPGAYGVDGARLSFGGDATGGGKIGGLPERFYAWAAVIENGRVVATDYAPDVGWLDPGSKPQIEGSPSPTSQVGPTPRVEDDPDVAGGRLWTVTVVNDSPKPATIVVAAETEEGFAGRLVGTVTPNVVPAGATRDVTFALPAKDSTGWAVFVNPGPDMGPLLMWTDVPLAGEIRIRADGQLGWLSP